MNWTLKTKNNKQQDFTTFPAAFRTINNLITEAKEKGTVFDTSSIIVLGPKDRLGDRISYSYTKAKEMADAQGLLNDNGRIDKRAWRESSRFME